MLIRLVMSLLLIASIVMATMGRAVVKQEETPNQGQEETLTSDEEHEARALVEDFIERLERSEDVTPLVNDFFVSDITERIRNNMIDLYPLSATPEVAAQLSSDEILRAYSASINCFFVGSVHYIETLRRRDDERAMQGRPGDSDEDQDLSIEEFIPPKLIELIQSDPALAQILANEMRDKGEVPASQQEMPLLETATLPETYTSKVEEETSSPEDLIPFKSVERMRHYTSLLEQGVVLLRDHINSTPKEKRLSVRESWRKLMSNSKRDEADENRDLIKPRLNILPEEFMGYPEGTRLIRADVLMFYVDMVRVADGKLKIVNMYIHGN